MRVDDRTQKNKFAIVQAEDELAAIGMVIGANWNGARAFTATSGPGISLMSEFLGLAYFAEVPTVLFDIQRGGPSTGMPTRTQQSDILCCAYASHGDTKHILLIPSNPTECFEFSVMAFDLADRLQTPIIILSDLDSMEKFGRYLDIDGDGIPYRTYPGTHSEKGAYFTRGSSHDEYAVYTEDGKVNARNLTRILKKHENAAKLVPKPIIKSVNNSKGVIYFGSSDYSMIEALDELSSDGIILDSMRIRAFPFGKEVHDFIENHDMIFVVEQNRDAQMKKLILAEANVAPDKMISVLCFDGMPITAHFISTEISSYLAEKEVKEIMKK